MKIAIFGSTGKSGKELVKQGLELGYEVTAFARTPEKLDEFKSENLKIVQGDVFNYEDVERAIIGQNAVLSALGNPTLKPNTTTSEGTRNIVKAMQTKNVRRFICETSLGVGDSREQAGFFFSKIIIPTLLKNAIADKEIQEQIIRDSDLDWTIVRPGGLKDSPKTSKYRAGLDKNISGNIARADLAEFMLKQLNSDEFLRQCPVICY
ncbi:MAG: SDR family oxidoreductase [Pyrinomonadaceae bacterium]|jgi:putative NADH-flavin reductase|nr:SDR family oxidoreductase [Pyrinomonadaceae bacterium]